MSTRYTPSLLELMIQDSNRRPAAPFEGAANGKPATPDPVTPDPRANWLTIGGKQRPHP